MKILQCEVQGCLLGNKMLKNIFKKFGNSNKNLKTFENFHFMKKTKIYLNF
jgi:hypothetical protein